jgi:hypothetical protein
MAEHGEIVKGEHVSRRTYRGHRETWSVKEVQAFEDGPFSRCDHHAGRKRTELSLEDRPFRTPMVKIEKSDFFDPR